MIKLRILTPILILAIVSLACSISVPLPIQQVGKTDIQTYNFNAPVIANQEEVSLSIIMGAGELNINSGTEQLIEGEIQYNIANLEPEFSSSNGEIVLSQNIDSIRSLPIGNPINKWDIRLGNQNPLRLSVSAGAYDGLLDLSGLPISHLEVSDGASNALVRFDEPNPQRMNLFTYRTGASSVKLFGLANANFEEMLFTGGAGSYEFNFDGKLSQDAQIKIESGVSSLKISIPQGTAARVKINGELMDVDTIGRWIVENDVYSTSEEGPTLNITVGTGVGSLELRHE